MSFSTGRRSLKPPDTAVAEISEEMTVLIFGLYFHGAGPSGYENGPVSKAIWEISVALPSCGDRRQSSSASHMIRSARQTCSAGILKRTPGTVPMGLLPSRNMKYFSRSSEMTFCGGAHFCFFVRLAVLGN